MHIENITILVEPLQPGEVVSVVSDGQRIPDPRSLHETANYIQLFNELKVQIEANVTLVEDYLQAAPLNGIVLLYPRHLGLSFEESLNACQSELRKTLLQRLVLLNVSRGQAYDLLEHYHLAATVDNLQYDNWWNIEQLSSNRQGLNGHIVVAREIGALIGMRDNKYCQMFGYEFERLPALLIRYLEAYVKTMPEVFE